MQLSFLSHPEIDFGTNEIERKKNEWMKIKANGKKWIVYTCEHTDRKMS